MIWESYVEWLSKLTLMQTYFIIFLLVVIVYKAAFAIRLPFLKTLLVYVSLFVGCALITFFHMMGLHVMPVLALTIVMVLLTRCRLWFYRRKKTG